MLAEFLFKDFPLLLGIRLHSFTGVLGFIIIIIIGAHFSLFSFPEMLWYQRKNNLQSRCMNIFDMLLKTTSFLEHVPTCIYIKRSLISFFNGIYFLEHFLDSQKYWLEGTDISHIALITLYAQTPPTVNILCQSGTFVTINEATLTYHYHPKSIIYLSVRFWHCIFNGFWQTCSDLYSQL